MLYTLKWFRENIYIHMHVHTHTYNIYMLTIGNLGRGCLDVFFVLFLILQLFCTFEIVSK